MIDEQLARLRAHRNNIHRYRQLLETPLTDPETEYIQTRLAEEFAALETLTQSTFPIVFEAPADPASQAAFKAN